MKRRDINEKQLAEDLKNYGRAFYYFEDGRRLPLDPKKVGVMESRDRNQPAVPLAEFARLMRRDEMDALTLTIFNALHENGYKIVRSDQRLSDSTGNPALTDEQSARLTMLFENREFISNTFRDKP